MSVRHLFVGSHPLWYISVQGCWGWSIYHVHRCHQCLSPELLRQLCMCKHALDRFQSILHMQSCLRRSGSSSLLARLALVASARFIQVGFSSTIRTPQTDLSIPLRYPFELLLASGRFLFWLLYETSWRRTIPGPSSWPTTSSCGHLWRSQSIVFRYVSSCPLGIHRYARVPVLPFFSSVVLSGKRFNFACRSRNWCTSQATHSSPPEWGYHQ